MPAEAERYLYRPRIISYVLILLGSIVGLVADVVVLIKVKQSSDNLKKVADKFPPSLKFETNLKGLELAARAVFWGELAGIGFFLIGTIGMLNRKLRYRRHKSIKAQKWEVAGWTIKFLETIAVVIVALYFGITTVIQPKVSIFGIQLPQSLLDQITEALKFDAHVWKDPYVKFACLAPILLMLAVGYSFVLSIFVFRFTKGEVKRIEENEDVSDEDEVSGSDSGSDVSRTGGRRGRLEMGRNDSTKKLTTTSDKAAAAKLAKEEKATKKQMKEKAKKDKQQAKKEAAAAAAAEGSSGGMLMRMKHLIHRPGGGHQKQDSDATVLPSVHSRSSSFEESRRRDGRLSDGGVGSSSGPTTVSSTPPRSPVLGGPRRPQPTPAQPTAYGIPAAGAGYQFGRSANMQTSAMVSPPLGSTRETSGGGGGGYVFGQRTRAAQQAAIANGSFAGYDAPYMPHSPPPNYDTGLPPSLSFNNKPSTQVYNGPFSSYATAQQPDAAYESVYDRAAAAAPDFVPSKQAMSSTATQQQQARARANSTGSRKGKDREASDSAGVSRRNSTGGGESSSRKKKRNSDTSGTSASREDRPPRRNATEKSSRSKSASRNSAGATASGAIPRVGGAEYLNKPGGSYLNRSTSGRQRSNSQSRNPSSRQY